MDLPNFSRLAPYPTAVDVKDNKNDVTSASAERTPACLLHVFGRSPQ